jgi:hypothetical protein
MSLRTQPDNEVPIYVSYNQRGNHYNYDSSDTTNEERRPLYQREVWLDLENIPTIPPAQTPYPGTTGTVTLGISGVSMTLVPGSDRVLQCTDPTIPPGSNRFINMVPANYRGGVYRPTLVDATGRVIPYDPSVWVADGIHSVIEFMYRTPAQLGYTLPLSLSYWQYTGAFAGGGGGGGSITAGLNLGTGAQLYKDVLGTLMRFRTLVAGSGITITTAPDELTISETIIPSIAEYYVSNAGSDAADGLTPSTPFLTLERAVRAVRESGYDVSAFINIISLDLAPSTSMNFGTRGDQLNPPIIRSYPLTPTVYATGLVVLTAVQDPASNLVTITVAGSPGFALGRYISFTSGPLFNYQPFPFAPPIDVDAWVADVNLTGDTVTLALDLMPNPGDTFDLLAPSAQITVRTVCTLYGGVGRNVEFQNITFIMDPPIGFCALATTDIYLLLFGVNMIASGLPSSFIQGIFIPIGGMTAGYQVNSVSQLKYPESKYSRGISLTANQYGLHQTIATEEAYNSITNSVLGSEIGGGASLSSGRFDQILTCAIVGGANMQVSVGHCNIQNLWCIMEPGTTNTALQIFGVGTSARINNLRIQGGNVGLSVDSSEVSLDVSRIESDAQGISILGGNLRATFPIGTDASGNNIPMAVGPASINPISAAIRIRDGGTLISSTTVNVTNNTGYGLYMSGGSSLMCNLSLFADNNTLGGILLEHSTLNVVRLPTNGNLPQPPGVITASNSVTGDGIRAIYSSVLGFANVDAQKNFRAGVYSLDSTLNFSNMLLSSNFITNVPPGSNTTDGGLTLINSTLKHEGNIISSPLDSSSLSTNSVGLYALGSTISGVPLPPTTSFVIKLSGNGGGAGLYLENTTVDWNAAALELRFNNVEGAIISNSAVRMYASTLSVQNNNRSGITLTDSTLEIGTIVVAPPLIEISGHSIGHGVAAIAGSNIIFNNGNFLTAGWLNVNNNNSGGIILESGSSCVVKSGLGSTVSLTGNGVAALSAEDNSEFTFSTNISVNNSLALGINLARGSKLVSLELLQVTNSGNDNINLTGSSSFHTTTLICTGSVRDGIHLESGSIAQINNLLASPFVNIASNSRHNIYVYDSTLRISSAGNAINLNSAGQDAVHLDGASTAYIEGSTIEICTPGGAAGAGSYSIYATNNSQLTMSAATVYAGNNNAESIYLTASHINFPGTTTVQLNNSGASPIYMVSTSSFTAGTGSVVNIDSFPANTAGIVMNGGKFIIDGEINITNIPQPNIGGITIRNAAELSVSTLLISGSSNTVLLSAILGCKITSTSASFVGVGLSSTVKIFDSSFAAQQLQFNEVSFEATNSIISNSGSVSFINNTDIFDVRLLSSKWDVTGNFTAGCNCVGVGKRIELIGSILQVSNLLDIKNDQKIESIALVVDQQSSVMVGGYTTISNFTTGLFIQNGSKFICTSPLGQTIISIDMPGQPLVQHNACIIVDNSILELANARVIGNPTTAGSGCVVIRNGSTAKFTSTVDFVESATYGIHVLNGSNVIFGDIITGVNNLVGGCIIQYNSHVTFLTGTDIRGPSPSDGVKVGVNPAIDWNDPGLQGNNNINNSDMAVSPGTAVQNCTCVVMPAPPIPPGF